MRQGMHQSAIMRGRQRGPRLLAGLVVFFMAIMAAGPAPLHAASKIESIMLSNQAGANGVVEKHQDTFPRTTAEIFGTALIAGAVKGKQVTTELFYMTKNQKVLSSPEDLTANGEVTFTFAFPKPEKGWPAGKYKLVLFTSDGANKEVLFQVK